MFFICCIDHMTYYFVFIMNKIITKIEMKNQQIVFDIIKLLFNKNIYILSIVKNELFAKSILQKHK